MSALACRCCGSTDTFLRGRKHGEFLRREFEFHVCRTCEFTFVAPFSGFEIYDEAYYRGAGADPFVDYETEYRDWRNTDRVLELDDLAQIASRHIATLDTTAPVAWLDFGCGAGSLLKYLRERSQLAGRRLELTGHDVGAYADRLKQQDGFRILDFDALLRTPDASFDIVSMIEVLEHLPEPLPALALAARLLRPGGLLLLTTGNLNCPVARRQGIHYRYCIPETHVSLFNPGCLGRLYAHAGLSPLTVRYDGVVRFKVLKSLRHQPTRRALAAAALRLPPMVRLIDALYGVSAMPCAIKPRHQS